MLRFKDLPINFYGMNNGSNGVIIGVLVLVVIGIVGWVAYSQGVFDGAEESDQGLEIQIGGASDAQ